MSLSLKFLIEYFEIMCKDLNVAYLHSSENQILNVIRLTINVMFLFSGKEGSYRYIIVFFFNCSSVNYISHLEELLTI